MLEALECKDADAILVTMGFMSGTARHVAKRLREQGKKVGVVRIISFRPFPHRELNRLLKGAGTVAVLERSAASGARGGPVW